MSEINIIRRQNVVDITDDIQGYHLPIASETQLGGIKVGNNLTIEEDGTLNAEATEYQLPTATASVLGGIKIGSGLSITDGSVSVQVDTLMSTTSTKPLQNATITAAINSTNGDVLALGSRVESLESTTGDISNSITGIEGDIDSIEDSVDDLSDTVTTLSSTVDSFSSDISNNTDDITALQGRMTTAEDDIDLLQADVTALKNVIDDEKTYSYLLPVSTWTAGTITLEKRGKVGALYVDIEGDLTLASGNSTIIYNYTDLTLFLPASGVLMTDDGAILGTLDDATGNFILNNISAHSQHITKLKGSIPLVFS